MFGARTSVRTTALAFQNIVPQCATSRRQRPGPRGWMTLAAAMPPTVYFTTGNKNKLAEVRAILGEQGQLPFNVEAVSVDMPELQGEPEEIAKEKCRLAALQVKGPVFVEDTCLCFNAYKGLPGPYVKWFLEKLGHDGLNRMLHGFDDKTGYALCTFAYSDGPDAEPHVFMGRTDGTIVPARGPTTFGWDPIFQPSGFDQTYAEMEKAAKNAISHRRRALDKLRHHLVQRYAA
ncbi:hypothetical protein ACKKBF_B12175 [Auxenochlorella protothecoides x Auxenochlorella symbiontica]